MLNSNAGLSPNSGSSNSGEPGDNQSLRATPGRVLVVDDEINQRSSLSQMLAL